MCNFGDPQWHYEVHPENTDFRDSSWRPNM